MERFIVLKSQSGGIHFEIADLQTRMLCDRFLTRIAADEKASTLNRREAEVMASVEAGEETVSAVVERTYVNRNAPAGEDMLG